LANLELIAEALNKELDIFEQDFVELNSGPQFDEYRRLLLTRNADREAYAAARDLFLVNVSGDFNKTEVSGGPVAVGRGATVKVDTINYSEVWARNKHDIDLAQLAQQLEKLTTAAQKSEVGEKRPSFLSHVRAALTAARSGDGPTTMQHLAGAGVESLVFAKSLGLELAAKASIEALGTNVDLHAVLAALPNIHIFGF